MQSEDIKELKARKKALKKEMKQIQAEIGASLTDVRTGVSNRIHYRYWIEKYPLHVVGSALLTGFLLARKIGSRGSSGHPDSGSRSNSDVFSTLLLDELKKMAARRAVHFLIHRVEDAIDNRKGNPE